MAKYQESEVTTKNKTDNGISLLKEQKRKEQDDVSDRTTVRKMRRYIAKLTSSKYGYTYDEVSEMLKGLGINLSGEKIEHLIGELNKSNSHHQKVKLGEENNVLKSTITTAKQPAVKANSERSIDQTVKSGNGKTKR
ncbi:hypothetical protein [Trichormus azollae]|jgi:hypothetical protein|uniref:Uncharacterized protein n=1 Tax=Nostoc azollae (strain 0708) TaxID=551115 RepID=D7E5Q2_NOSA0|nr:hypothetical protein [Trichormus azollae]ADI66311.1 hypothetical protein Aazo_5346 ['Nostoc azollae' 0708]